MSGYNYRSDSTPTFQPDMGGPSQMQPTVPARVYAQPDKTLSTALSFANAGLDYASQESARDFQLQSKLAGYEHDINMSNLQAQATRAAKEADDSKRVALNDYALQQDNLTQALMQKKLTPAEYDIAQRQLRDNMIKNYPTLVSYSDLRGVEKLGTGGVEVGGTLLQNELQNIEEARDYLVKQQRADEERMIQAYRAEDSRTTYMTNSEVLGLIEQQRNNEILIDQSIHDYSNGAVSQDSFEGSVSNYVAQEFDRLISNAKNSNTTITDTMIEEVIQDATMNISSRAPGINPADVYRVIKTTARLYGAYDLGAQGTKINDLKLKDINDTANTLKNINALWGVSAKDVSSPFLEASKATGFDKLPDYQKSLWFATPEGEQAKKQIFTAMNATVTGMPVGSSAGVAMANVVNTTDPRLVAMRDQATNMLVNFFKRNNYYSDGVSTASQSQAAATMQTLDGVRPTKEEIDNGTASEDKVKNVNEIMKLDEKIIDNPNATEQERQEAQLRWSDNATLLSAGNLNSILNSPYKDSIRYDGSKNEFVFVDDEGGFLQAIESPYYYSNLRKLNNLINSPYINTVKNGVRSDEANRIKGLQLAESYGVPLYTGKEAKKEEGSFSKGITQMGRAVTDSDATVLTRAVEGAQGIANIAKGTAEVAQEATSKAVEKTIDTAISTYNRLTDEEELDPEPILKGASDLFSKTMLAGEDMTQEAKDKAAEEFYNQTAKPFFYNVLAETPLGKLGQVVYDLKNKLQDTVEANKDMSASDIWQSFKNSIVGADSLTGKIGQAVAGVQNKVTEGVSTLKDNLIADVFKDVAPFNLQTIDKIMQNEVVSADEAKAALTAYNKMSVKDKLLLNNQYNVGMFDKNVEQKIKETIKDLNSLLKESSKSSSKKPRSLKEEYIPGIL